MALTVTEPLKFINNLPFNSGLVSDQLKLAKVMPVYKKGDANLATNYRAKTNVFIKRSSKILDRANVQPTALLL